MAIVMCGAGMMLKAMGGNELTIRRNSDGRMEVFMDGDKLGNGYPVKNEAWLDEKTVCAGHA